MCQQAELDREPVLSIKNAVKPRLTSCIPQYHGLTYIMYQTEANVVYPPIRFSQWYALCCNMNSGLSIPLHKYANISC